MLEYNKVSDVNEYTKHHADRRRNGGKRVVCVSAGTSMFVYIAFAVSGFISAILLSLAILYLHFGSWDCELLVENSSVSPIAISSDQPIDFEEVEEAPLIRRHR